MGRMSLMSLMNSCNMGLGWQRELELGLGRELGLERGKLGRELMELGRGKLGRGLMELGRGMMELGTSVGWLVVGLGCGLVMTIQLEMGRGMMGLGMTIQLELGRGMLERRLVPMMELMELGMMGLKLMGMKQLVMGLRQFLGRRSRLMIPIEPKLIVGLGQLSIVQCILMGW